MPLISNFYNIRVRLKFMILKNYVLYLKSSFFRTIKCRIWPPNISPLDISPLCTNTSIPPNIAPDGKSHQNIIPWFKYRKISNITPGLMKVFNHILGAYIRWGLYSGGLIFGGTFALVFEYKTFLKILNNLNIIN